MEYIILHFRAPHLAERSRRNNTDCEVDCLADLEEAGRRLAEQQFPFEAHRRGLLEDAEVGRLVQAELLADIPRRACDLDVAHIYISSHERARLAGDSTDSFPIDPDGVGFLIGDMSGHGLDAVADSLMLRSLAGRVAG